MAPVDTSRDADLLRAAMKGFGTDERALITVLAINIPDPLVMASLRQTYSQRHRRDLLKDINKETSSYFREGLEALVRGPLDQDVYCLRDAIAGAGTKETALDDVLLGRTNADMHAIKAAYHRAYNRSLESDVKGDLSMKTQDMFALVLSAQRADESSPVIPQQLESDVSELHRATGGTKFGTDQTTVYTIFSRRSDGQLRAISKAFQQRYQRPLKEVIRKEFSGHMESALLRQLGCAEDRAMADAEALEASMAGMGTKDRLLVNRLVRLHWNKAHLQQVNGAYRHRYRQELWKRVEGEASGDYKRLCVALVDPSKLV